MSKRHSMQAGDWVSVVRRLEELVVANYGGDPFDIIFKLLLAKLVSEQTGSCPSNFESGESPEVTAQNINRLLECAQEEWADIFNGGPTDIELEDSHLDVCVRELSGHQISNAGIEVFDSIFETLASHTSKGAKGQFFTPRHVIECGVRIVRPEDDELIVDPACGSAGFLVHSLHHILDRFDSSPAEDIAANLFGFEFDQRARRVAKALLALAGGRPDSVVGLNSLRTPDVNYRLFDEKGGDRNGVNPTIEDVTRTRCRKFDGFDVLLTNPPFAGEVKEEEILASYELARSSRKIERDVLFLERCIQILRPGGRFGIVLPDNKVGSPRWEYVRQWLVQHARITAVVGLPRKTFQPHTHQKASFVFGTKRRQDEELSENEEIIFIISEESGKDSSGSVISRETADPSDPIWIRADHDLDTTVEKFWEIVDSKGIDWGVTE